MRPHRSAVRVRALPTALVLVLAVAHYAAHPSAAVEVTSVCAVVAASAAAIWPDGDLPALVLAFLAASFLLAARGSSGAALLVWTVGESVALWVAHALYALAASVPLRARVGREVSRQLVARGAAVAAGAVPLVTAVVLLAASVAAGALLRTLGVVAVIAACALAAVAGD